MVDVNSGTLTTIVVANEHSEHSKLESRMSRAEPFTPEKHAIFR